MTAPVHGASPGGARGLAQSVGATLGASLLLVLLLAVANVIVSRLLGVEGRGIVAAATLIPMIVGYAGELGIPVATGYLINVRPRDRETVISSARALGGIVSVILVLVSAALSLLLPLPPAARGLSVGYSVFAALNLLHRVNLTVLQADLRLRLFNGIRVLGAALYVGVLVGYLAAGIDSELAVVLALVVLNTFWFACTWASVGRHPGPRLDRPVSRALLGYGVRAHIGNVAVVDALRVDQLVLALFLAPTQLGLYVAAMTVITANRVIGTSVGVLCFPMAAKGDGGRDPGARRQFRKLIVATAALSGAVALVEWFLGGSLLTIFFGPDFAGARRALQILALASVAMNLRQMYADWLRGAGRPGPVAYSELVSITTLGLGCAVLWDGSVLAVAWAVSLSSVASLACLVLVGALRNNGGRESSDSAPASVQASEAWEA
ncbi:MAG: oligosaccharide flippase family protein [Actinomycetota bacterium]|nr:oligosaccharide flippase family protein [Actinomycetota bacterium]